eukprot:Hpha_TRINITY_DN17107_c0_g1::TRINITY_DN17107_c0_g1_i1::g.146655::m.146655/K03103/MINPP1; multiple inositol-polyphosphate phosphatase / 2,3-bisphosphoglycerate 3-phosphatase
MYILNLLPTLLLAAPPVVPPVPFTLNTKTPYWSSEAITELYGVPSDQLPDKTCKAVRVVHLSRHGSRYGEEAPLLELEKLLQQKGSAIKAPGLEFLRNWSNPFASSDEYLLDKAGMEEHYGIGARHRAEFGQTTMAKAYSPETFPFQATWKSRTSRSGMSFALAAFMEGRGPVGPQHNMPIAMLTMFSGNTSNDGDVVLRPFANCPAYHYGVKKNDSSVGNVETQRYLSRNMTTAMLPKIAHRMELDSSVWTLTMDDLDLLMNACIFETTALNISATSSPCAVFDKGDFEMWSFYQDLSSYYNKGPGIPLSTNLVCPTMNRMLADLITPGVQGSYLFTHAETMMPMLSFLGLYTRGAPLTADMEWKEALKREWNGEVISSMAVNIDMVAYDCAAKGVLVELRHNERPVMWPRCGANGTKAALCSPEDVIAAYPPAFCDDWSNFCSL